MDLENLFFLNSTSVKNKRVYEATIRCESYNQNNKRSVMEKGDL